MAEKYADYYMDKSKILALIREGEPKEREIALGSLVLHFGKEDHFDLVWNIFLSDEHYDVKEHALSVALKFATTKQLFQMAEYIIEKDHERRDLLYSSRLLRKILEKYKKGELISK